MLVKGILLMHLGAKCPENINNLSHRHGSLSKHWEKPTEVSQATLRKCGHVTFLLVSLIQLHVHRTPSNFADLK